MTGGAPRLLCDEMLAGLARLLRSGGHDTALAEPGSPDEDVAGRAEAEGRILVTRDRALAKAARGAVLVTTDEVEAQAARLFDLTGLPPAPAPFSRCVMDNACLRQASEAERDAAPADKRDAVYACPDCGRVYWAGSHVRRMSERLRRLSA